MQSFFKKSQVDSNVNSTDLLQQAQAAQTAGAWTAVNQCLHQLTREGQIFTEPTSLEKLQSLATEVLLFGDFQERWDVAKVFPRLGKSGIATLIEVLTDPDAEEELRWFAARILGEFDCPEGIAALVKVCQTSDSEELKGMVATALGNIGLPAIASLTNLLAEEDTKLLAVTALAQMRRTETIPPLLIVVQDPQVAVRAAAIEALSSFHDSRIPPILLQALNDVAASVRREAVIGLGFRPDLAAQLHLVEQLSLRLYDFNLGVCCCAASALGRLGTDDAATALYQVLMAEPTPMQLKLEIVRALSWLETAKSLEYLGLCLQQSSSSTLSLEIVTVLGRYKKPALTGLATQILLELLPSISQMPQLKQAVALSLGQLGDQRAIEPLIQLLVEPDAGVRLHVITALKQLAPEVAQEQLQEIANNTLNAPDVRQGAAMVLANWSLSESKI